MQEHEISKALFIGQKTISLQEKITNDENNEATHEDMLENNEYATDYFEKESLAIDVNRLLTYLSDKSLLHREKKILLLYF
jgi:DNA-directed RNA polymerase sigma subunit (sigma70/sigma32)